MLILLFRTNKVRAKTSHEKKNRAQQDDRSNQVKIDQLHRVYGEQLLILSSLLDVVINKKQQICQRKVLVVGKITRNC